MIKYPYTDFHEMNLDWLLQQMKELNERMDNFVTEITADIIPIVQQAIEEGLIDVTYDSTNETVVLVPGAGVTSQHLAKFFQINNFKYPVADQTARNTINNWISGFNYTPRRMYKKAVIIGDSYLAGWTPDGDVTSWGVYLAGLLGLTVDTSAFIYSQGGAGFGATNAGRNFVTMLQEAVDDNRFDNDDVDLIVVGGGFNDQYVSLEDITNRINQFATLAKNNMPNARVYVANMTFSQITAAYRSTYYYKVKVANAYALGCAQYGLLPFLDCWKALWGKTSSGETCLASDDAHPNDAGQRHLAWALEAFITTGSYSKHPGAALVATNQGNLYANVNESGVTVFCTNPFSATDRLNTNSGYLNGSDIYIDLPSIKGFEPVTGNKCWGTATAVIKDGSKFMMVNAIAGIVDGHIRLFPVVIADAGNNYYSATNLNYVQVQSISMFVPDYWA